jgi:hypothetical protein
MKFILLCIVAAFAHGLVWAEQITPPSDENKSTIRLRQANKEPKEQPLFGSYKIHLFAYTPTFKDQSAYEKVYKTSSTMPGIGVEYFFFDYYVTLGLHLRAAYYTDNGRAISAQTGEPDRDGKVRFTMTPVQAALSFQATPFERKWAVVSGWFGLEHTNFEETRLADEEGAKSVINRGERQGITTGMALSLNMTALEPAAVASMRYMGIQAVYLTPFIENVTNMENNAFSLARTSIGAAITFETF